MPEEHPQCSDKSGRTGKSCWSHQGRQHLSAGRTPRGQTGWGRQGERPRWQERQAEQGKDTGCLSSDCCAGIVLGVKIPNLAQAAYILRGSPVPPPPTVLLILLTPSPECLITSPPARTHRHRGAGSGCGCLKRQQGQLWLLIYIRKIKYGCGFPFYKFLNFLLS